MRSLILIHGRSQQGKKDDDLKGQWLAALQKGLAAADLDLEVPRDRVRLPFYGDTLDQLTHGRIDVDDVVVQGGEPDAPAQLVVGAMAQDLVTSLDLSEEEIRAAADDPAVAEMGPQNWPWVLAVIRAAERRLKGAGPRLLELAVKDVHAYLSRPGVQTKIEGGVRKAFDEEDECVVVAHSLGSVVAYNVLARRTGHEPWAVPSLVTVGSPLAVRPIVEALAPISRPTGVDDWLNAYDPRDVVALHPLDPTYFPVQPGVENYDGVDNFTDNRHGIAGYLSDPVVARRIHDALVR
jgi:hypothetical protein